jgi:hypothetical protein
MINLVLKRSARVAAETEQCVLEMDLEIGIGDAPWLVGWSMPLRCRADTVWSCSFGTRR